MRYQNYSVTDRKYTIWTACDIDPLLNSLIDKDPAHPDVEDERMPYWAELWPSSILMAETIIHRQSDLPEGKWLELGCGPAFPGVVAGSLGLEGTCTDYMQEALWLARLNLYENNCKALVKVENLDWRKPSGTQKYAWIFAGDVTYEKRNFAPLLSTFEHYLEENGEIWIGEPGRGVARSFFQMMGQAGWFSELIHRKNEISIHRFIRSGCRDPSAEL